MSEGKCLHWRAKSAHLGGHLPHDGLKADEDAVFAGLTLPWSNGQTEAQVNRLKVLKRSMYGRANFDLLRPRVLWSA
jgi:transposase